MSSKIFWILGVAALAIGLALFWRGQQPDREAMMSPPSQPLSPSPASPTPSQDIPEGISEGTRAKDFTLAKLNGGETSLRALSTGKKATYLRFYATWCPFCKQETPGVVKFYKEYKDKGVEVIFVDVGERESLVRDFYLAYEMNFPMLLDKDSQVFNDYRAFMPTSLVLDGNGVIIKRFNGGAVAIDTLEELIRPLVEG